MESKDYHGNIAAVTYFVIPDRRSPVFLCRCPRCGRFVKPDKRMQHPEADDGEANGTCKRCGRIRMPLYKWYDPKTGKYEEA